MGKTFKIIEMVGTSEKGYEDAIQSAVAEASKTLKGLSWYEVVEGCRIPKEGAERWRLARDYQDRSTGVQVPEVGRLRPPALPRVGRAKLKRKEHVS